jgi:aspartyl-tRNA(Asn)/glutamyl-tRNA(Gln) amidotransferase subunit C
MTVSKNQPDKRLPSASTLTYNNRMKIDVTHVAKLADLTITPEETEKFEKQLSDVLDYIKKLDEVDVSGIEPTSQVTGLENVIREDDTEPSLTQDEALSGAKAKHNGFFMVKGIFEDE